MRGIGDSEGSALVLTPLRHDRQLRRIGLAASAHLRAALDGEKAVFPSGVLDYRGADVWSATRTLPDVGWGLVVKIDSAEESLRAVWLRDQMVDLGLALGAIAILGGTLLGFHLGRPLRDLKEVVERIRAGERDLRADATARDEVGFLASALNDLLDDKKPE
jgi:methyl-accepting chemotaxis protein